MKTQINLWKNYFFKLYLFINFKKNNVSKRPSWNSCKYFWLKKTYFATKNASTSDTFRFFSFFSFIWNNGFRKKHCNGRDVHKNAKNCAILFCSILNMNLVKAGKSMAKVWARPFNCCTHEKAKAKVKAHQTFERNR